jgi:hypothetical protein
LPRFGFHRCFLTPSDAAGFDEPGALRFELAQSVPVAAIKPVFGADLQRKFLSSASWAILQSRLYFYCSGGRFLMRGLKSPISAYAERVSEEYSKFLKAQTS